MAVRTPVAVTFLSVAALAGAIGGCLFLVARQESRGTPDLYRSVHGWAKALGAGRVDAAAGYATPDVAALLARLPRVAYVQVEKLDLPPGSRKARVDVVLYQDVIARSARGVRKSELATTWVREPDGDWRLAEVGR